RSFIDKVTDNGATLHVESRESVTVAGEVDRVYRDVSADVISLAGSGIGAGVVLVKKGFSDVVVWNPWVDKAKAMADFGDEEPTGDIPAPLSRPSQYKNMICIEFGEVSTPVTLPAGQTWEAGQTLVAA
ncbi:hypothetical protein BDK51DRAFT_29457, partial [Blyttiomyces helicus]